MSTTRQATVSTNVNIPNVTETVIATLAGIQQNFDGAPVILDGWFQVNTGGSTTGVSIAVRRGVDITGTLIGEQNVVAIQAAAGNVEERNIIVVDNPGAGGPYAYVLTCQQVAAAGAGTAQQAALVATTVDAHGT